jgi:hypothetical protein
MWPIIIGLLAAAAIIGVTIYGAMWVQRDAVKRGVGNKGEGVIAFMTGPFGFLIWLLRRPPLPQPDAADEQTADT